MRPLVHLILLLYRIAYPVLYLLYWPFYRRKLQRRGGQLDTLGERRGRFSVAKAKQLEALKNPVWIHAVSVGELNAALVLIAAWRKLAPELPFVLTTTTNTAQQLAKVRAPDRCVVIYAPLDLPGPIKRFLTHVQPRAVVIMEVEIWPQVILQTAKRDIPIAIVNGRMSDRSYQGFLRWKGVFSYLFSHIQVVLAQAEGDCQRFRALGASAETIGSMKFDLLPEAPSLDLTEALDAVFGTTPRTVLLGASTHAGEEASLARVYAALRPSYPGLRLVIVPRHAERGAAIAAELEQHSLTVNRRSLGSSSHADILLADTTGELLSFIQASDLVFVGKSLPPAEGGQNVIEPAVFAKPLLFGPNMGNFRNVVQLLLEGNGAVQVADEADFEAAIRALLADPKRQAALGTNARAVVDAQRGAADRTVQRLRTLCL